MSATLSTTDSVSTTDTVIRGPTWKTFIEQYPPWRIMLLIMFLILSISLNDVKFRWGSAIKKNYWIQLVIVAGFTYLALDAHDNVQWQSRMVVVVIVTSAFYLLTAPKGDGPEHLIKDLEE